MLFHNTFWVYFVKIAHNSCQAQCSSPFTCNPFWHLQYGLPNDDQAPKTAIERDRPPASCVGRSLSSIFSAYGSLSFCATACLKSSSPIKYFPVRWCAVHTFLFNIFALCSS